MSSGAGVGGIPTLLPDRGYPAILLDWNTTGTSFSQSATNPGGYPWVLLGVDWTATQAEPIQCFTGMTLTPHGGTFFYDSQSTGEGNGVRWQWRGMLVIPYTYELTVFGSASGSIDWGGVAWGIIGDYYTYVWE